MPKLVIEIEVSEEAYRKLRERDGISSVEEELTSVIFGRLKVIYNTYRNVCFQCKYEKVGGSWWWGSCPECGAREIYSDIVDSLVLKKEE